MIQCTDCGLTIKLWTQYNRQPSPLLKLDVYCVCDLVALNTNRFKTIMNVANLYINFGPLSTWKNSFVTISHMCSIFRQMGTVDPESFWLCKALLGLGDGSVVKECLSSWEKIRNVINSSWHTAKDVAKTLEVWRAVSALFIGAHPGLSFGWTLLCGWLFDD